MNWKRFFALLLVLALLPALFGNAFAAGPKARTLTDADYAPIDALWAELDAVFVGGAPAILHGAFTGAANGQVL